MVIYLLAFAFWSLMMLLSATVGMTLVISYVQAKRDYDAAVTTNTTFSTRPGSMFAFQSVSVIDGLLVALILLIMEALGVY